MISSGLSIGELADRTGLSRRAIRFYVQRGLLEPPSGKGRGSEYEQSHVDRLIRIKGLQEAGHSLEAIKQIMAGKQADTPVPRGHQRVSSRRRPTMEAGLWTRVKVAEGIELNFDATRFSPTVEDLLALKQMITQMFDE